MSTTQTVSGIGVGGASFLVLLTLKVMGYINMHWFWVLTSFVWVPLTMFLVVMALMAATMIAAGLLAAVFDSLGWFK